jgi:acetolactate synthase-1/2/3 large subunit
MAVGLKETTRAMTGWQAVVEALRAESVPYVFGLPGDPGHLYDAVYELEQDGGPRAIGVRYETSGAFLAMAYQRVSGRLAACFGCPGPGIANLVPGVLEAFSGSTPCWCSACVPAARRTGWAHSRKPITSA